MRNITIQMALRFKYDSGEALLLFTVFIFLQPYSSGSVGNERRCVVGTGGAIKAF